MSAKTKKRSSVKHAVRPARRKRPATSKRSSRGFLGIVSKNVAPLLLSGCIIFCLAVIIFLGYRSVTASDFFELTRVEIRGANRTQADLVERIVTAQSERTGVWNADLLEIKARIEKQPFVRSATVSRVLPDRIRVQIFEHEPKALVKLKDGNYLAGSGGEILAIADKPEESLPFVLSGWDEGKSERTDKENAARVEMYQAMLADWSAHGIIDRVEYVDLASVRDPRVMVVDSGNTVSISVGRENFGENLSRGLKAIAGKGNIFKGVELIGARMMLSPREPSRTAEPAQ